MATQPAVRIKQKPGEDMVLQLTSIPMYYIENIHKILPYFRFEKKQSDKNMCLCISTGNCTHSSGPTSWCCVTAYTKKILQGAGPTASLQPTQLEQPNHPIPYPVEAETTETGITKVLCASYSH